MSFEKLIGNEQVKETLNNIIQNNSLTHSYMFVGPSGVGKTLFAKEFAKMILCENKETKPCGKCKSCIELQNNNNPDLIEIEPENTAIKIEQIRQMQSKILEKPIISDKKVYIIKDADQMTKDASNCLLKTLEEPPSFITIIMTGTNESLFLNTIKSRCVKIAFNKIQDNILKKFLENNYGFTINDNILKACEGSIEKAIRVNERKQEYEEDAKVLAKEYYNQNGNIPSKELFRDYFPLFTCDENEIKNNEIQVLNIKEDLPTVEINIIYDDYFLTTAPKRFIEEYIKYNIE